RTRSIAWSTAPCTSGWSGCSLTDPCCPTSGAAPQSRPAAARRSEELLPHRAVVGVQTAGAVGPLGAELAPADEQEALRARVLLRGARRQLVLPVAPLLGDRLLVLVLVVVGS